MGHDEHADKIREALRKVEKTHRVHGRAVAELHKALADYVAEHGSSVGLDEFVTEAAVPKDPPPNDGSGG